MQKINYVSISVGFRRLLAGLSMDFELCSYIFQCEAEENYSSW